jgi:hypothetical protein
MSSGCLSHHLNLANNDRSGSDHTDFKTFFDPPLSEAKIEAIGKMKMGGYKKVILTFNRVFWPSQSTGIGWVRFLEPTRQPRMEPNTGGLSQLEVDKLHAAWIGNCLLGGGLGADYALPCLEVVMIGHVGESFAFCSDSAIQRAVLLFLKDAMGLHNDVSSEVMDNDDANNVRLYYEGNYIDCIACSVTRWEEDPFCRGAYSHLSLGGTSQHAQTLADPEYHGQLVFAGEYTVSKHEGSVHGALMSGMRAASHVQKYLEQGRLSEAMD